MMAAERNGVLEEERRELISSPHHLAPLARLDRAIKGDKGLLLLTKLLIH